MDRNEAYELLKDARYLDGAMVFEYGRIYDARGGVVVDWVHGIDPPVWTLLAAAPSLAQWGIRLGKELEAVQAQLAEARCEIAQMTAEREKI